MFEGIFSPEKLLLIAAVALIFVGPKRLPQIGRSIGRWLGEMRRATGTIAEEVKEGLADPPAYPSPPPPAIPTPAPGPPPPPVPPAQATAVPPPVVPGPPPPPPAQP